MIKLYIYILSYICLYGRKDVLIIHKDEALQRFVYMMEYRI